MPVLTRRAAVLGGGGLIGEFGVGCGGSAAAGVRPAAGTKSTPVAGATALPAALLTEIKPVDAGAAIPAGLRGAIEDAAHYLAAACGADGKFAYLRHVDPK